MKGYRRSDVKSMNPRRQGKGNGVCVQAFVGSISEGGAVPVPYGELLETHRRTFEIADLLG